MLADISMSNIRLFLAVTLLHVKDSVFRPKIVDVDAFRHVYQDIARSSRDETGVPEFNGDGLLDPGRYIVSWDEFGQRFSGSRRRRKLLKGLHHLCIFLKAAGCKRVGIGGSFVTSKKRPGDFDGCWDIDGVNMFLLKKLEPDLVPPKLDLLMQAKYGGSLEQWCYWSMLGATYLDFLQFDDRRNKRKGVVIIDLATFPD